MSRLAQLSTQYVNTLAAHFLFHPARSAKKEQFDISTTCIVFPPILSGAPLWESDHKFVR